MIQKSKKAQFNLIDVLIIAFILGLIAVVIYWMFGGFQIAEKTKNEAITFEVRISNVKESTLPFITEGLSVRDSVTGETVGTIVAVRSENSRYEGSAYEDGKGGYVLNMTEHPEVYDVYVTISAEAESDDRGIYTVGNTRMLIGATVYFQVKSFSAVSYIVNTALPE
jgi:hypothetical protein